MEEILSLCTPAMHVHSVDIKRHRKQHVYVRIPKSALTRECMIVGCFWYMYIASTIYGKGLTELVYIQSSCTPAALPTSNSLGPIADTSDQAPP